MKEGNFLTRPAMSVARKGCCIEFLHKFHSAVTDVMWKCKVAISVKTRLHYSLGENGQNNV